jgi:hypothetical protein
MRDHQQGHVNDRERVSGNQLPCPRRQAGLDAVVVVQNEVDRPDDVEGDDVKSRSAAANKTQVRIDERRTRGVKIR